MLHQQQGSTLQGRTMRHPSRRTHSDLGRHAAPAAVRWQHASRSGSARAQLTARTDCSCAGLTKKVVRLPGKRCAMRRLISSSASGSVHHSTWCSMPGSKL